jgi:hypothetical protein
LEESAESVVVDAIQHESNETKNIADAQSKQNEWIYENSDKIFDKGDNDCEQEINETSQLASVSIPESQATIDEAEESPDFDLCRGHESSTGDDSSSVVAAALSNGQNPLSSFSTGFSSYIGNMPDVTSGLGFSSYINGTTFENAGKDNALVDSSAKNEEMTDSGFSSFEPPTNIDNVNRSQIISLSAVDEDTMNKSMEVSTAIYDSDKDDTVSGTDNCLSESDDIDEMYGSETESQVSKEKLESEEAAPSSVSTVPRYAIDKFMTQLERIHADHEIELKEMEKKHTEYVIEMKDKLQVAKQARKGVWGSEVSNHDKCLLQQRQLEKEFNVQLQQREYKIAEISEVNSSLQRQVEESTLESNGLNLTIQARYVALNTRKNDLKAYISSYFILCIIGGFIARNECQKLSRRTNKLSF